MGRQIINDTFSLEIPDSFESMGPDDLDRMRRNGGDPFGWGVRDRENHVLITAVWKKYPALLAWAADLKSVAKKNQEMAAAAYEGHGYRLLGFFSAEAGDETAEGYRYSYSAGDVTQVVTTWMIKDGKTVYAILCAGREENGDRDRDMFRGIMESLEYV